MGEGSSESWEEKIDACNAACSFEILPPKVTLDVQDSVKEKATANWATAFWKFPVPGFQAPSEGCGILEG